MDAAVDVGAAAPANEAVIPAEITEAPAAPSIDEDLRGIWDKHHPARDDAGKFASRNSAEATEQSDPAVTEPADQTAETKPEQATPAIEAPISWSAEQKAKWATLPPDTQAYIAQRDKESHEAISRAGQQIKAFEPIRKVVEQFGDVFERNGLQPHDAFARMMAVEQMLEQNPRAAIEQIAKAYNVDLSGQVQQDDTPVNPRIAELESRLARAESYLTAQQRQQVNAENAALAREIADFAKDKPHFEAVRSLMAGLLSANPEMTLAESYERAVYADPTIRQSVLADEQAKAEAKRKEDEAKRVKEAKKAAGVNVRSSPGQTANVRSLDDDLREIARKHYGT